jgi:hypothetical protein
MASDIFFVADLELSDKVDSARQIWMYAHADDARLIVQTRLMPANQSWLAVKVICPTRLGENSTELMYDSAYDESDVQARR